MFWIALVLLLAVGALVFRLPRGTAVKARQAVYTAGRNLRLHKLRAFLSVLGIIIGTSSVIVLMAFGEGSMQDALEDIKAQGAANIIAVSVKPAADASNTRKTQIARYGLTVDDALRFSETLRPLLAATLATRSFAIEVHTLRERRAFQARLVATQPRYADVYKLHGKLAAGRFLADQDERQLSSVAVIGADVAHDLFPSQNPIGRTIKLKDRSFEIVGVFAQRTPSSQGGEIERFNADVYIPLGTWRERIGRRVITPTADSFIAEEVALSQIVLTLQSTDHVRRAADIVRAQLDQFHGQGDVELRVPLDRLEEAERARLRYQVLLFFIAGISLLVGGIGIMNIMLATVTERTREIGIRRALGATRRDITLQFLIEACFQTMLGGVIGVGLGLALVVAIPGVHEFWQQTILQISAARLSRLPVQIHLPSVFLAFFVAVTIGVLFGWYPARRAARLDPIEALRHE